MSESFWKKASTIFGLFTLGTLFGLVAYVAQVEIKDLDLWLHLAVGRFITLNHYIPQVDILSFTMAGKPWINHEWLFQVIVYNIFNAWGVPGLLKMQVVVVITTMFFLLFLGYNKDKQILTIFTLVLVFLIYQQRFTIRPDIYSLLFFVIYIFVLALHIDKRWSIVCLFIVQVLWSNMHGFFFFGPLFMALGIICEWMKRHIKLPFEWNQVGRLNDSEFRRMRIGFVFVVLACFINPYFIKGALYPLTVFFSLSGDNKIFFNYIQELQKPITRETIWDTGTFGFYKLTIALSFLSFIFNRRKIDISALFLWLVFLIFSLNASRNIAFFAVASYLVIITNALNTKLEDIVPFRASHEKFVHITSMMVKLLMMIWIFQYAQVIVGIKYYDFSKYEWKSEFGGISQTSYPSGAADFLAENNVKGNFFNDFNSGAYLLGRCFPNIKVFIDGRTELHGAEFFEKYRRIWNDGEEALLNSIVDEYHITGALLNSSRQFIPKNILKYFYNHKDWKIVYFNHDAVVFLKDVEENRDVIKRFVKDLTAWQAPPIDLARISINMVVPYQSYYRGYTLESLDLDEPALQELQEALKAYPSYALVYQLMGRIYAKRHDYGRTFENFRVAAMFMPGDKETRYNLALAYFDMGDDRGAIKQYESILKEWPGEIKAYFFLARTYAFLGEFENTFNYLQQATRANPEAVGDVLKIGDIFYNNKEYEYALKIYELALQAKKKTAVIYKKLGSAYKDLGDLDRAQEAFSKGLSLEPEDEEIKKALKNL